MNRAQSARSPSSRSVRSGRLGRVSISIGPGAQTYSHSTRSTRFARRTATKRRHGRNRRLRMLDDLAPATRTNLLYRIGSVPCVGGMQRTLAVQVRRAADVAFL